MPSLSARPKAVAERLVAATRRRHDAVGSDKRLLWLEGRDRQPAARSAAARPQPRGYGDAVATR